MQQAILSTGSNLGRRRDNISSALDMLGDAGVKVLKVSSFYETAPVGPRDQPDFINGAALVETGLEPAELLRLIKQVESGLGRDPGGRRWGPRPVDIDIIFFGRLEIEEPGLVIPHPRFAGRLFVLEPVLEVAPDFVLPDGTIFSDFYLNARKEGDFPLQRVSKLT